MTDQSNPSAIFKGRLRLPESPHLHTGGPGLEADKLLVLKQTGELALRKGIKDAEKSNLFGNLSQVSEDLIREIEDIFGKQGVFKFNLLATVTNSSEFTHFLDIITSDLVPRKMFQTLPEIPFESDNPSLKASPELNGFNHNVINSSLSRKLFNPGRGHGYLVYGIGGPRILVSLPFIGASKFVYDVYGNSIDVVTSLNSRGYLGTFLLLDSMEGLNKLYFGRLAWLLWFSIISVHADVVLFAKEKGSPLSDAQQLEIAFTPDRVAKKIVELNSSELTWAKKDDTDPTLPVINIMGKGIVTDEEWDEDQLKLAGPFLETYKRYVFPDDRLIILHENGGMSEYPLDNPWHQSGESPKPRRRWWPFGRG